MTNLKSNILFDKSFPKQRVSCSQPIKTKGFEKDIKQILKNEKIIDYRCYLQEKSQIIYYMVETIDKYIAYQENLLSKEQIAYAVGKNEFNEIV